MGMPNLCSREPSGQQREGRVTRIAFAMGYMISIGWGYLAGFWMAAGCFAISLLIAFMVTVPKGINSKG